MAINFLGGLKREYHHVKALRKGSENYEPAMVLLRDERPGCSFIVPLPSLWKYIEPKDNRDPEIRRMDLADFDQLARKILFKRQLSIDPSVTADDCAAVIMAEQIAESSGFLYCTAFSLVKCCQILSITVCPQSLAQLLMFIQDGLDDLRKMRPHEKEDEMAVGEVTVEINGKKFTREITVSEADVVAGV